MRTVLLSITLVLLPGFEDRQSSGILCKCPDQQQADNILGTRSELSEITSETSQAPKKYRCTYTVPTADAAAARSNLFYRLDVFSDDAAAHREFRSMRDANAGFAGQEELQIGDEAWSHSDGANFTLVAMRTGSYLIVVKVNKLTHKTSATALRDFVESLAAR